MLQKTLIQIALLTAHLSAFGQGNQRDFSFSERCEGANSSAVISFVGDILIHDDLYKSVVATDKKFSTIWRKTNPLIQKADFSVANLEGPAALGINSRGQDMGDVGFIYDAKRNQAGGNPVYSGTNMVFNFHPKILEELKNSGYDLLTMANNHALDRYGIGIDRTILAAQKVGIPTVGTRPSDNKSFQYYHLANIKGIGVAFISCTEELNGNKDSKDQVLSCFKHAGKIVEMITTLNQHPSVDAIVVLPHWGQEYQANANKNQKDYARRFLDAGATAIIGSHPHVLQPWEKYITQDGRETLIMYSLGNFVAFQAGLAKKTGVVAYLGLSKRGQKAAISGVGFSPTYRDGYTAYPVDNMPSDMAALIKTNFGTDNQISSKESISKICK